MRQSRQSSVPTRLCFIPRSQEVACQCSSYKCQNDEITNWLLSLQNQKSSRVFKILTFKVIKFLYIKFRHKTMEQERETKAIELKEEGNNFFKAKDYQAAIKKYDEAIEYCPKISVLFSNKARCYKQLEQFEESYKAAEQAVQLDQKNIKAYFLMAENLVEIAVRSKDITKIQSAIDKLKTSLRLCPSQGKNQFQERFVCQIYRAKKKLWELEAEAVEDKKKALRSYLASIVEGDQSISQAEKDQLHESILTLVDRKYGHKEAIPQALVCPISKSLMKDPVCNEYGNSYSKKVYIETLNKNGRTDPITNKPIKTETIYPNINLKKAIERFLDNNPWAYEEVVA